MPSPSRSPSPGTSASKFRRQQYPQQSTEDDPAGIYYRNDGLITDQYQMTQFPPKRGYHRNDGDDHYNSSFSVPGRKLPFIERRHLNNYQPESKESDSNDSTPSMALPQIGGRNNITTTPRSTYVYYPHATTSTAVDSGGYVPPSPTPRSPAELHMYSDRIGRIKNTCIFITTQNK